MSSAFKRDKRGAARASWLRLSRQIFGYRQAEISVLMPALDPYDIVATWDGTLQPERQPVAIKLGCNIPGYVPVAPAPEDVNNAMDGMKKRVGRRLPVADDDLMRRFEVYVQKWLREHLTPLQHVMTFEDWLETTTYNTARKLMLTMCWERLHGGPCPRHVRRKIDSFLKREQYASLRDAFKYARWINSRSDYFKAYSGRFFKSIEEVVYADPHFIKHVPVADRPTLISRLTQVGAKYYSTDYKSFEAHFIPKFMHICECALYRYMLSGCEPEAAKVICETIEAEAENANRLHTRSGVRVEIEGRRMSGDMCTSLGNGFTNLMLWSFLAEESGCRWEGYVEGDDGIFAVYEGSAPTEEMFAKLGWKIVIEEHERVETAGFCGCKYVAGHNVRDPYSVLCSFGWSMTQPNCGVKLAKQLLRAKALSLYYELSQCPIIGALSRRAILETSGSSPRFENDGYHDYTGMLDVEKVTPFAPPPELRAYFATEYGIAEEIQLAVERSLAVGDYKRVAWLLPAPAASVIMERMYSCG